MLILQSLSHFLFRALDLLQSFPLRVDWEEVAPPRKSLMRRLTDVFSGNFDPMSIFDPKYLINWVEIFVILSILLFVAYVAHALNLFGSRRV